MEEFSFHHHAPVGQSVLAAIRSSLAGSSRTVGQPSGSAFTPFITFTHAEAAVHPALLGQLLDQLNVHHPNPPWQSYDRELVEQVARDHGLSEVLIRSLQDRPHSMLEDILEGLRSDHPRPPDEVVYAKVVATLRTLAWSGRAVLIGRGGVFCTQDMPGGVHVQFVAPMEFCIRQTMQLHHADREQARRLLADADAKRMAFYARFWRKQKMPPASADFFTVTLNSAAVPLPIQISTIVQLVLARTYDITVPPVAAAPRPSGV